MRDVIWIVLDEHGEIVDFCADELTAYAIKKEWENRMFDYGARVIEKKLKTREDVKDVVIFTPEDEGADEWEIELEKSYDA